MERLRLVIRNLFIVGLFAMSILVSAQGSAGFELEGQVYSSISALEAAAAMISSAENVTGNLPLYCGHRLTTAIMARGHYDGRYDPVVCFTTKSKLRQLLAMNQALRTQRSSTVSSPASSMAVSGHDHRVCDETPRGTPFSWVFYSGAWDDVCPSHPDGGKSGEARVRSYWQVGSGGTQFFFDKTSLWYVLDVSIAVVNNMMKYSAHSYRWCGDSCPA